MLRRHDDGLDADRQFVLVEHRDLGLAVGTYPGSFLRAPERRQSFRETVGKLNWHRHQLVRLVGGVPEHHSLITRAAGVDSLRDIWRLFVDGADHRASFRVKSKRRVVVADSIDRRANYFGNVDVGLCRDLTGNTCQTGSHQGFAGDSGGGIVFENCIEDGIRDRVRHLVGMTLGDGFGCEQMSIEHDSSNLYEDERWQRSRAVLFARRGCLQSTGALEDISILEVGQPVAQERRITECRQQSPSQLAFGLARGSGFERRVRRFCRHSSAHSTHDSLDQRYRPAGDA